MASISVVTRPSKREDGKKPIYIRIHHKDKTRYLSLRLHVAETHWNSSKGEVRRSHPRHRSFNRIIKDSLHETENALYDLREEGLPVSAENIKKRAQEYLEPEEEGEEKCFINYSESLLENWRGRWARSTKVAYQTALRHLTSYAGRPLPFSKVTPEFCRGFLGYLTEEKGMKNNTAYKTIAALKRFYNDALEDSVIEWEKNPFSAAKVTPEVAEKEKLTTEELRSLKELELEEETDLAEVRRLFFFSFYSGGMRFSDVVTLRCKNIVRSSEGLLVRYRVMKTQKEHEVRLPEEAEEILRFYDWEEKGEEELIFDALEGYSEREIEEMDRVLASINGKINNLLKELAEEAEIEKEVTFHLARHSAAAYLLEKGYIPRKIQKILGHSSVATTVRYLEGFKSEEPEEEAQALDRAVLQALSGI